MTNNELFFKYENANENIQGMDNFMGLLSLKNRELCLSDVDTCTADAFNTYIRLWNILDNELDIPVENRQPIKIFIDSNGGDVVAACSIIDTIKLSKTPVWTINIGCAYSSALEIFIVGSRRIAYPYSTFLFHEGSVNGVGGDANKFRNFSKFYDTLLAMTKENILAHTALTEEDYDRVKKDDWWLTAQEALEYKMCDEIAKELI